MENIANETIEISEKEAKIVEYIATGITFFLMGAAMSVLGLFDATLGGHMGGVCVIIGIPTGLFAVGNFIAAVTTKIKDSKRS